MATEDIKNGLSELRKLKREASDKIIPILKELEKKSGLYIKKMKVVTTFDKTELHQVDFDFYGI